MKGKAQKAAVYGGQALNRAVFPPTKYIQGLLKAYCPDAAFDADAFASTFEQARTPEFDAAFAAVTPDGASCGQQLCWCLLDIPAGTVLPLHAHKNLEVVWILRGCMYEKAIVGTLIPVEQQTDMEIDWLDCGKLQLEERAFPTGTVSLNVPGSIHQIYADKAEGCLMVILYSKDCTFIRATDPVLARQLLPATPDHGTIYQTVPVSRNPSSFITRDPGYARFRAGLMGRQLTTEVTVAQVVIKALADCDVMDAIVYPGAKCIELLKVVDDNDYGVRGWLCRNEHAGAFEAEGYAKSQGERMCAIITTSGPGATNLCTGIASAWRDGVPMVVITSQVSTYKTGTSAFQEVPTTEIYRPITKGAFAVTSAEQAYDTVVAACKLAVEGVNGPVLIDLPENVQSELVSLPHRHHDSRRESVTASHSMSSAPSGFNGSAAAAAAAAMEAASRGPAGARVASASGFGRAARGPAAAAAAAAAGDAAGLTAATPWGSRHSGWLARERKGLRRHSPSPIAHSSIKEVMRHIRAARRPLLLLGGGCVGCDAALLNELVEVLRVPVCYTFMGKGCISDDHPLCLGPIGVHGLFTANTAVAQCDLVLALGCRFDERAACKSFELWQVPRAVIHVDLKPQVAMSGSPRNTIACSITADVEDFVGVLLQQLYGLLEERMSVGSKGLPELDELQEMAAFAVDADDLRTLSSLAKERTAEANKGAGVQPSLVTIIAGDSSEEASCDTNMPPADNGHLECPCHSSNAPAAAHSTHAACGTAAAGGAGVASGQDAAGAAGAVDAASPFCKASTAANAAAAAAEQEAAEADEGAEALLRRMSVLTMADPDAGEFTYAAWAREMSDMKSRRWKSLMPVLSAKSELTTREMVHLLDSYLSAHGLQPIVCSDVGSHQCLLAQYLRLHSPRQWLTEGGLASMGCGLPAAIGAAMANPGRTCLAVAGDGGFAMTSQELIMAKVYKLNVKVIVTVNNRLQLVEQLEEENYDSLDVFTFIGDPEHPNRPYPHFSKLAEAYGVSSITAWTKQGLLEGLSHMFSRPGPFLLEVVALAERPHIRYWDDSSQ